MKKLLLVAIFLFNSISFGYAATQNLTPQQYIIAVTKVEFYNSDTSSWVTVAEGAHTFDVASVNAGQAVGTFIAGANLTSGTYTKMRSTVSRDIQIKAYTGASDTLANYYTTSGQQNWPTNGLSIVIATGADPSGSVQLGTLHCPDEANPDNPAGYTHEIVDANYFRDTMEGAQFTPFTYTSGAGKKLRLSFDVTNTVVFNDATNTCQVNAPIITVTEQ